MNWFDILKMPIVEEDFKYADSTNPIIFISDPSPLPQEKFDEEFIREYGNISYGRRYKEDKVTRGEDIEISNYGRVKVKGIIQEPILFRGQYRTKIEGHTDSRTGRGRHGGATISDVRGKPSKAYVPYSVTFKVLTNLNMDIPQNAKILGDSNYTIEQLNQMKTKEVAERKERERVYQIQQAKQEQERLAQKPKNRTVYRTPRTRTSTQQREREPIKRRSKKYYKRLPTTRGKKR